MRWVFWAVGGVVAFVAIAATAAMIYFTDERIRLTAEHFIHDNFGRAAHIEGVDFSVFSGITITNLEVCDREERGSGPFVSVERVRVKYSLLPLITGRFEVDEITVDKPRVYLTMFPDGTFSFSDLIAVDTTLPPAPVDTTPPGDFPVTLDLRAFKVNDAEVHVDGVMDAHVRGVSLAVEHIEAHGPFDVSGMLRIATDPESGPTIDFSMVDTGGVRVSASATLDANFAAVIDLKGVTNVIADVSVLDSRASVTGLPDVRASGSASLRADYDFQRDSLELHRLLVVAKGDTAIAASGRATALQTDPTLDVRVERSRVRLEKWNDVVRFFAPTVSVSGTASLANSRVRGRLGGDLRADGRFSLDGVGVLDEATGMRVDGVNVYAAVEAHPFPVDPSRAVVVEARATVDEIAYPIDTANTIAVRGVYGNLNAVADTTYLPSLVVLSGGVADLFGGDGEFAGRFGVRGDPYNASGDMTLRLGPIDLSHAPGGMVKGSAMLTGRMSVSTLGRIVLDGRLAFQDVAYLFVDYFSGVPDGEIAFGAEAGLSRDFADVRVPEWSAEWPTFFSARGSAGMDDMGAGPIRFAVAEARASVPGMMRLIPEEFQLLLADAKTTGECVLSVDATVRFPEPGAPPDATPEFDVNADARVVGVSFHEESNFGVDVKDAGAELLLHAASGSASVHASASVGSADLIGVLDQPLSGIYGAVDCELRDEFTFLRVRELSGGVRSHSLSAHGSGEVYDMTTAPRARFSFAGDFLSTQPVSVAMGVTVAGKAGFSLNADLADSLASLFGSVHFQYFSADVPIVPASITEATGQVAFSQLIDLTRPALVKESGAEEVRAIPISTEYDRWRVYRSPFIEELADVTVKRVEALRFRVDDIQADVSYENNALRVDRMTCELYEGNVLGRLFVDVGEFDLGADELDLSGVSYGVSGIAANINASLLSSEVAARDTAESRVSADMHFTGRGVPDLKKPFELEGELNVTRIGPDVTRRLLDFLDPTGTDVSLAQTRQLLTGSITGKWRPRWFKFRIAYGNVYPSLYLDQPFFAKLFPISMPIEYSRIPLSSLLEQALVPVGGRVED